MTELVDLEAIKAKLGKTADVDDDELLDVAAAASAALLNHPDYRVADACQETEYTEWHDGGSGAICLQHYPVASVTSVTEYSGGTSQVIAHEPADGSSFTGYGWDYEDGAGANGILVRSSSGDPQTWTSGRVKVVYTAGVSDVPADVREAALKLVKHMWGDQRGGSLPLSAGDEVLPPETAHLLPWEVEELLAPYRRGPRVG